MEYKKYGVEDFVLDKRFKKWLLNPEKEDNLYWEEWLKKHPEQISIIEEAKNIVLNLPQENHILLKKEKSAIWDQIQHNLSTEKSAETRDVNVVPLHADSVIGKANQIPRRRKNKNNKWGIAAILIMLTGFSILFTLTDVVPSENQPRGDQEIVVKSNPWGQKSTVYLSDGSEVVLNSGSSLTYLKDFGVDERLVELTGEAFFNVAKDENLPFRVVSKELITEALGTSFNVRAFKDEPTTSVSLVTGKVVIKANTEESNDLGNLVLTPGEQADYSDEINKLSKSTFEMQEICGWKEGIIFFSNAGSEEVFTYLEQWYGVTIVENNPPYKNWNYTGEFKNLDLNNVLNSIGFTMNFEFTKKDKTYYITYSNNKKYD